MSSLLSYSQEKRYKSELCVCGFIRTQCLVENVPQALEELCVEMYFELMDQWDVEESHPGLKFEANQIVLRPKEGTRCQWISAMGTIILSKGDIKTWRIKILQSVKDICFGITDIESKNDAHENASYVSHRLNSHGFGLDFGSLYSYDENAGRDHINFAKPCEMNNIISMTVDMTGDEFGIVSYACDDKDLGVAFKNIKMDKQYTMIVSFGRGDKIQLLQ